MLPTAHKRLLCAAFAALVAVLAAAPAHAAKRPKLKTAYATDSDRDGHVDGVKLRWSKKVRGGRDNRAPFSFRVKGHRVIAVGRARGKSQRLRVVEGKRCDTGGSIRLKFRPARKGPAKVRAKKGRAKVRKQKLDMSRFDPPIPRITCAITLDSDSNGRVDGVRVTYSRKVRSRADKGGRFLFGVAGYRVTKVGRARGRFLRIDLAEGGEPDSGATPTIEYSQPRRKRDRRYAVRSGRRNKAFTATYQGTRDGVSPQLVSGATGDRDHDGLLDSLTVRFSEPVNAFGTDAIAVLGMQVTSASANGSAVTLALAENTARGDARPGAWVAGPGVVDMAGNAALRSAVFPADAAPPVMLAAVTQDTGGSAGHIDAVTVAFSEPVAHARDAGGLYPFLIGSRRVTSVEPASGAAVQVRIAEASSPDSGERPSVRHIPGNGLPIVDHAGNGVGDGLVNALDGVAPVLLSAVTADADSDGRIDRATLNFSETVVHGAEGGGSFSLAGHQVTGAAAASGPAIGLTLAEAAAADSGATPAVSYSRDGVEDVSDAAGNVTGASSVTARDGARPVLLSARTGDVDDDGRIDRVDTTWSEPLVHSDDTSAPFALSASDFSVARVRAASGTGLAVDLVEPAGHDTGSRPALTYAGATPLRDAAGLEPAQQTWTGLTADALPPRLVAATTRDTDADGSLDAIDARFSEPVVHTANGAPTSFTVAGRTVLGAGTASDDLVELQIQESGTSDSGLQPLTSYTAAAAEKVRDASGNRAPLGSQVATDGAAPVLLSAATADGDDDGVLDRVTTTWSEPLKALDDGDAPFPVSAAGFTVARVQAAGTTVDIDITEPGSPDTGSAPTLTYTGNGSPLRDVNDVEPAKKSHPGVTRDALPPRRISTATVDLDSDGRLDGVEIEWSEPVTGNTASAPFTVTGRALAANVVFNGRRTRIPFTETGFDTDETPNVAYDAAAGDLHDVAAGTGDLTDDAPAVAAAAPLDKAPPILVDAETADLQTPGVDGSPNGTIDAVRARFSEPIAHSVDGLAPFSLNVAGRGEWEVEGDTGPADDALYVHVNEGGKPDGGETPSISVQAVGPVGDRIKDRAASPNEARPMTFAATIDNVRPVLLSAELGEQVGGSCTSAADQGIDGQIDCVRATWSEPVQIDEDAAAPYSVLSDTWTVAGTGIPQQSPATTLVVPLAQSGSQDRDRSGTNISYAELNDLPVEDPAGGESLNGSVIAGPACRDTGDEGNDARDPSNPTLVTTSPAAQRKCAFDADWYRVVTSAQGFLEVVTRPAAGVDLDFELRDGNGLTIASDDPPLEAGAAGAVDRRTFSGLDPSTPYYLHVKSGAADETVTPQEGPYCVVFANAPNLEPGCGPLTGQIVFTEVGFGNDKFVEIKNDFDIPVDMAGAGAELVVGPVDDPGNPPPSCTLTMPGNPLNAVIDPDEHVLVEQTADVDSFGCDLISSLDPGGERLELRASGSIDVVDFTGIVSSAEANEHSLQFVEGDDPDAGANDEVDTRWCRTFAADTRKTIGDGCDEYRINEVLWKPTNAHATSDGKTFVELAGNIPALANSELLGGWVLRGVNGVTGGGTADFVLPAAASPRPNGIYVIADGVAGVTAVGNSPDIIWNGLDLNSTLWPDGTGSPGPRGLQLLTPDPGSAPPCTNSADAFGWTTTAQGFSVADDLRACPGVEGQEYANGVIGPSAARDDDATDTGNNRADFCPQTTPNPGLVNTRPDC